MPEIPQSAIDAAVAAYLNDDHYNGEPVAQIERMMRTGLEAAAPVMAEAVAAKIKAHGEKHFGHMRSARVRFDIAARIAAGAFDTKEDRVRMINQALESGNYIVCDPAETGEDGDRG